MIVGIIGKLGQGKTFLLTKLAIRFIEQGYDVSANYPINLDKITLKPRKIYINYIKNIFRKNKLPTTVKLGTLRRWYTMDDFLVLKRCKVLMDETRIYFDAERWRRMTPAEKDKLLQSRKDFIDIYYTAQRFGGVYNELRNVTDYVFKMRRIHKLFVLSCLDPDDVERSASKPLVLYREYFTMDKRTRLAYDTYSKVSVF